MKRFWKDAAATAEGGITLDGKPVRTPGRAPLIAPTETLAQAIADEWAGVGETIDPRAMPLTGLANAAIDRIAPDPAGFARGLAVYGESDLLCYRAAEPAPLVARQAAHWDPVLAWARTRYDMAFEIVTGIIHRPQPAATLARLGEAIAARSPWRLAPLSQLVTISGSLVIALAVDEGALAADAAWAASELDADWQTEQWGEDALAAQARDARRRDFDAAIRFLSLLDA